MDTGAITRRERSAFIAVTTLTLLYVLARAALVPLVHDEAASYLWFVQPGELIPFHAHWDANNHVVNTVWGYAADRLFGPSLLALRGGNVLAFLVYALASYRLGRVFTRPPVRWCCWAALLWCPFVLDLFSLFRGYGIGMAGLLLGVERVVAYCHTGRPGALWTGMAALVIALYADLSLVPTVLVLLGIAGLRLVAPLRLDRRAAVAGSALLFGGAATAYAIYLALLMQRLGLLYHGSLEGFVPVSVRSLCRYVLGADAPVVVWGIAGIGTATIGGTLFAILRERRWNSALSIIGALFAAEVAGRIVLGQWAGVNYPEDRAGVQLVPLAVLTFALLGDRLARTRPRWGWAAVVLLFLPLRTLLTLNVDHTQLWPEQSVPLRFLRTVAERQARSPRPLLVGGYHQLALCWPLGARMAQLSVPPLDVQGFPGGTHDLRIVDARFLEQARAGYREIDHAPGPGLWLLERTAPPALTPLDTSHAEGGDTSVEFMELAAPSAAAVRASELQVEVLLGLHCTYPAMDLTLVTEVNDSSGTKLFYDSFSPLALQRDWRGDTLQVLRRIPQCPTATRAVVYLYNGQKRPYAVTGPVVRTAAVRR